MILFISFTIWILFISTFRPNTIVNNKYNAYTILFSLIIFVGVKISNIDLNAITDLSLYFREYASYSKMSLVDSLKLSDKEPLFITCHWLLSHISISPVFFKISIWALFIVFFLLALRKIFVPWQLLIVFFSYITYFIFFGYVLNTMRQGLAISLLIFAITTLMINKKCNGSFLIAIILAPLFHFTSLPLSIALLGLSIFKLRLKVLLGFWGLSAVLFILNLNSKLLGGFNSSVVDSYSTDKAMEYYVGGTNRVDFLIFSSLWIIIGILYLKYSSKNNESYRILVKAYVIFNTYFLLMGFVAFSDRLAAYSWFLAPLLIWEPVLKSNKPSRVLILIILLIFLGKGFASGNLNILLY